MGLFLPRFNLRRQPFESRGPAHPDDVEQLEDLRQQGSKLDLPHPVRAFLVFDSEDDGRQAGERLGKEGYQCSLRAAQDGSWVLTAVIRLVPTGGALTRLREQAEEAASDNDGSYRGWNAPVVY